MSTLPSWVKPNAIALHQSGVLFPIQRVQSTKGRTSYYLSPWANVQLIAASPQLLEILDAMLPTLPSSWIEKHSELYEQASAAVDAVIAKEDR